MLLSTYLYPCTGTDSLLCTKKLFLFCSSVPSWHRFTEKCSNPTGYWYIDTYRITCSFCHFFLFDPIRYWDVVLLVPTMVCRDNKYLFKLNLTLCTFILFRTSYSLCIVVAVARSIGPRQLKTDSSYEKISFSLVVKKKPVFSHRWYKRQLGWCREGKLRVSILLFAKYPQ